MIGNLWLFLDRTYMPICLKNDQNDDSSDRLIWTQMVPKEAKSHELQDFIMVFLKMI